MTLTNGAPQSQSDCGRLLQGSATTWNNLQHCTRALTNLGGLR